ncbi:hypothetical protein lerEdw1_020470, partial [Lerista edwardsae]
KKIKEEKNADNKAATKIQAHYRGYRERRSFKRKRASFLRKEQAETAATSSEKEKEEETPEAEGGTAVAPNTPPRTEEEAAVILQSTYRGYRERKKVKEQGKGGAALAQNPDPEVEADTAAVQSNPPDVERCVVVPQSSPPQTEEQAAVILQSNYRGYRQRKKVREQGKDMAKEEPSSVQSLQPVQNTAQEVEAGIDQKDSLACPAQSISLEQKTPEENNGMLPHRGKSSVKQKPPGELLKEDTEQALSKDVPGKAPTSQPTPQDVSGADEKNQAPLIPNEGRPERGSLKHGRTIPCENKASTRRGSMRGSHKHIEASKQTSGDKERAALVIQSNYRGYRRRGQLKKEGKLPCENQERAHNEPKGGGHSQNPASKAMKERQSTGAQSEAPKNAIRDGAEKERSDLAAFSKQISKLSEDYLALQQKLNEMILSHRLRPAMLSKDKQTNGHLSARVCQPGFCCASICFAVVSKPVDSCPVQRTPRRPQKPKMLNTPEDSTYYTLIHKSIQEEKRKPRKNSLAKVLDADDPYYQEFSPSDAISKDNRTSTREKKAPAESRTATLRVSEGPRVVVSPLEESKSKDNPYDYRKLLRKTSQRRRLIQQY